MRPIIVSLCLLVAVASQGGEIRVHKKLDWKGNQKVETSYLKQREVLSVDGGFPDVKNDYLPMLVEMLNLSSDATLTITLENARYEVVDKLPEGFNAGKVPSNITFNYNIGYIQKRPVAKIVYTPVRKNAAGQIERLVEFDMKADVTPIASKRSGQRSYASYSVLSSGNWYKVAITQDGMFKMDYAFLKGLGIDVDNIDPLTIRVFGNGGGMLPESNAVPRHDDLTENPIIVSGEGDGKFNTGDFVLFYGKGPNTWGAPDANGHFLHNTNIYSATADYFITFGGGSGRRMSTEGQASNPNTTVTTFDDHQVYEQELTNLLHSGRTFYGDYFNFSTTNKTITFDFPNVTSDPIFLRTNNVGRCIGCSSTFSYTVNGAARITSAINPTDGNFELPYAYQNTNSASFATSNPINVTINFSAQSSLGEGWLDYVEINARRNLTNTGGQMSFRDTKSVGTGKVSRFTISNANDNMRVLEVTDPTNAQAVAGDLSGGSFSFTQATESLREFFVYQDNGSFPAPTAVGGVANQNLHATGNAKMVIMAPSALMDAASKLADYHRNHDGLNVALVNVEQVYDEFSSGVQDLVGLRDFVRMLYDRAGGDTALAPKYLLLFGRASYDYKNITANNTNLVPVYESANSLDPVSSYCTDDFFAFLDATEGADASNNDLMDIAVGRIPAATLDVANGIVNKIIHYTTVESLGSWRNNLTVVGDDIDGGLHMNQADNLATIMETHYPAYNVDKIYLDAYKEISTPAGDRYPDVNDAINKKMYAGSLVMNYTGHGGVYGLSHTRCMTIDDIRSWKNIDKLTLWVTATCEFTKFDNPDFISAGEEVLNNPNGGAIALVSTVRLSLSSDNEATNKSFMQAAFNPVAGSGGNRMPTLGEAVMISKNASPSGNTRKYDLFGDPAVTLAYPKFNCVTTNIDKHPISIVTDTLKALQKVTIRGEVRDLAGNKMTSFNGTVYPTIFDKQMSVTSLGNNAETPQKTFKLLKNIIFKGKASVTAGEFSYTFIVPKDIAYNVGYGKISYYADNNNIDAHGYTNILIGGNVQGAVADNSGPELKLFMNNEKFVFGGLTDANPLLLVDLSDISGINTAGNGVGHDISGVLDENTKNTLGLNDYYEAEKDNYQKGTVKYPLAKLANGRHSMKVKAWDVYNNSAEGYTEFVVASSADLALSHVLNYPNPFTTSTNFQFEHNKPGEMLFVQVKIYTVSGKLVKTIQDQVQTEGYRVDNIHWDGLDDYGDKIGKGVYVYKLAVSSPAGGVAHQFEKLVILR